MGEHVPMERNVPSFEIGLGDHGVLAGQDANWIVEVHQRYENMRSCKGDYEDRNDQ
jgi:hypothetical protein